MRTISQVAQEIKKEWKNVYYGAVPYLSAMMHLTDKHSTYGMETAKSVVIYFLANAQSFRGDKAKELKAELKEIVK